MNAIDHVMTFWDMMSEDEKKQLILRIGEKAVQEGMVSMDDLVKGKSEKPKRRRGRSTREYWMKSIDGLDDSKKGVFKVVGAWVNDVQKDLCDEGLVLVGTKDSGEKGPVKRYHLCKRRDGHTTRVRVASGELAIQDLCELASGESFRDIEESARIALEKRRQG